LFDPFLIVKLFAAIVKRISTTEKKEREREREREREERENVVTYRN